MCIRNPAGEAADYEVDDFGYMEKDFYLEEHDPQRWAVEGSSPSKEGPGLATGDD